MSDSLLRKLLWGLRRQTETQSSPRATVLNREEGHRIMTSPTTGCMMSWAMLIPCRLYCYLPIIYSFTSANVLPKTTPTSPKTPFQFHVFYFILFIYIYIYFNESILAYNFEFSIKFILFCKAIGSRSVGKAQNAGSNVLLTYDFVNLRSLGRPSRSTSVNKPAAI